MMTAGIVCEYNPFHNGHKYHIDMTRAAGASHIVCVMSGNYVQRGEAACLSKRTRARMAVDNGADLVLELPVAWAVSSAESFARGSVFILSSLGIADMISFGSESGDVAALCSCARAVSDKRTQSRIADIMSTGCTYPAAVRQAVCELCGEQTARSLDSPNDTLNVEYIRALDSLESRMKPFAVKRTGGHDVHSESAMSIRKGLFGLEDVSSLMPAGCAGLLSEQLDAGLAPCSIKAAERAVLSSLRMMTVEDILKAPDVTQGLENRIYKSIRQATSLDELYELIKTKRYTMAKVRRVVLSLYLGIPAGMSSLNPPYIRILAANRRGLELMSAANPGIPVISRYADAEKLDEFGRSVLELECRAGDLFALCSPKARPCGTEMTDKLYINSPTQ